MQIDSNDLAPNLANTPVTEYQQTNSIFIPNSEEKISFNPKSKFPNNPQRITPPYSPTTTNPRKSKHWTNIPPKRISDKDQHAKKEAPPTNTLNTR